MARMPYTEWNPATDSNSTRTCTPNIVCVHTIVGYAPAKAAHFSTRADGHIWQHRDTTRQSAANLNGNPEVIAIENEDHGPAFGAWNTSDGHAVPGFTAAQMESNAQILAFCYRAHGIPLELIPDTRPGRRGIGYHRQGIDSPNNFAGYDYKGRVSGGVVWTSATGKICPGDRRIHQLIEVIIPRARRLVGLDAPVKEDMELDDKIRFWDGHEITVGGALGEIWQLVNNLSDRPTRQGQPADTTPWVSTVKTGVSAIRADVADLKARPVADVEVAASAVVDELIARGVTGGASPAEIEAAVRSGLNTARITTD
jgi:hypothetical protein